MATVTKWQRTRQGDGSVTYCNPRTGMHISHEEYKDILWDKASIPVGAIIAGIITFLIVA